MSKTKGISDIFLASFSRLKQENLTMTEFKIMLAIDKLDNRAKRVEIVAEMDRNLNGESVRLLKSRGMIAIEDLSDGFNRIYEYSLTRYGLSVLRLILTGKETA